MTNDSRKRIPMPPRPQSFERHARLFPLFHFFVLPVLLVNFFWAVFHVYRAPSGGSGLGALVAAALIGLALSARRFALTVQDRVIRLEMRVRMRQLLPADLQGRIAEFTVGQLIALRFASDEELPSIAAAVLRDKIQDKKTIKKMVKDWQADHLRA
jgi:hypothetical protein